MGIGLDIGTKTIKVAELKDVGGKLNLVGAGVVGYNGPDLAHIQDDKQLSELAIIIKKLFQSAKISSKDIAISLPESQVFTRPVVYPLLTDQEIASAIKWEAEQYIPIPLAEAIVQHTVVERRENATPPGVLVLLVASPRVLVEKYIKLATMAGLNCIAVETELIALTRALAPANQTAMILDLGSSSTDIAITKNGQLVFSRSIPTAGDTFTRAVAQSLGASAIQAEEYKRTYGFEAGKLEGKVAASLGAIFRIVTEEIKKSISYYQSEEKGEAPGSIILSGGSSGLPEVATTLAKSVGIEVIVGNPFTKLVVDPDSLKSLVPFAPLYPIAIGLAERND
ncbi:MAG: type IV pilus assembly protein PilM [Patescibacteria group bacterium]